MTTKRYVRGIHQPHVLRLMVGLLEAIFLQDNAHPYTAKVSKDCTRYISTLPPFPCLLDPQIFLPFKNVWDHLGKQVGQPTSLDELEARFQQQWKKNSHDIIRDLLLQSPTVSHYTFMLEVAQQTTKTPIHL
ncbi:transposable element Tcb2 transposase [Trichonephila clavipes]|nr:transposable element Tcb2 transposase [Trichonephila clavipes]